MRSKLAVDGGDPVRTRALPGVTDPEGRTLGDSEVAALERVVRSARLWCVDGTETPALETEFAALHGVRHAVAATSGTAGLHLAVAAVDPDPGDEIIVPPITDFGTVIPVLAQNAVPVFADVDPVTGNMDPADVARKVSARTKAIICVHLFGRPAPVVELRAIADRHRVALVEDCAQAYLAVPSGDDRPVGGYGHLGCFSLQQSKHITCGDGGLVLTDDDELARRMRLFADKGWPRAGGERTHLLLGLNYRMTELQAAVARAQLVKLPDVVGRRREIAARMVDGMRGLAGVGVPETTAGHSFWLFPIVLDPDVAGGDNAAWARALAAEGIPANGGYIQRPVYDYPVLTERRTYGRSGYPLVDPPARPEALKALDSPDCPVAERLVRRTLITLPCNEGWSDGDADDVVRAVRKVHAGLTEDGINGRPLT